MRISALLFAAACSSSPRPMAPIPISVVAWPSPIRPTCHLPDLPKLPEVMSYESFDPSLGRQVYVRQATIDELRAWLEQIRTVVDLHRVCLEKLTGNP